MYGTVDFYKQKLIEANDKGLYFDIFYIGLMEDALTSPHRTDNDKLQAAQNLLIAYNDLKKEFKQY